MCFVKFKFVSFYWIDALKYCAQNILFVKRELNWCSLDDHHALKLCTGTWDCFYDNLQVGAALFSNSQSYSQCKQKDIYIRSKNNLLHLSTLFGTEKV